MINLFRKKPKLSYKVITSSKQLTQDYLKQMYEIRISNGLNQISYNSFKNSIRYFFFEKNTKARVFLLLSDNKIKSHLYGSLYTNQKTNQKIFEIANIETKFKERSKGYGFKIYSRAIAYLRVKDKITDFYTLYYNNKSKNFPKFLTGQKVNFKSKQVKRKMNSTKVDYKITDRSNIKVIDKTKTKVKPIKKR